MLNYWQRIEKIIDWSRATSINAFARNLGLNRAENLYQIKRGNNGISQELAKQIKIKYPEVNKGWLLSGEGTMLASEEDKTQRYNSTIPFYEKDIIEVLTSEERPNPSDYIILPPFKDCEIAAISYGEAMSSSIPNGSIVLLKRSSCDKICPGEVYLILSIIFVGIRTVRRECGSNTIRLEADKSEKYDDILIDINDINEIYIVKGIITKKTM